MTATRRSSPIRVSPSMWPRSVGPSLYGTTADVTSFSTPGANLLVSAFGDYDSIVTTDRTGADGYADATAARPRLHTTISAARRRRRRWSPASSR